MVFTRDVVGGSGMKVADERFDRREEFPLGEVRLSHLHSNAAAAAGTKSYASHPTHTR